MIPRIFVDNFFPYYRKMSQIRTTRSNQIIYFLFLFFAEETSLKIRSFRQKLVKISLRLWHFYCMCMSMQCKYNICVRTVKWNKNNDKFLNFCAISIVFFTRRSLWFVSLKRTFVLKYMHDYGIYMLQRWFCNLSTLFFLLKKWKRTRDYFRTDRVFPGFLA